MVKEVGNTSARDKAHYKGPVVFDQDWIVGPDTAGAYYRMVGVKYNWAADMSTVYFKPYLGWLRK